MRTLRLIAATCLTALLVATAGATSALAADAPVSGIVSLDGVPTSGVAVGWFDPYAGTNASTVTATDGSYTLAVPDGHPYVIYAGLQHTNVGRWMPLGGDTYLGVFVGADSADYLYQSLTAFTAPTVQNIALSHPGSIVGKAKALAKQRVTLESLVGQSIHRIRASATGRFEFHGLVPGRYRITAFSSLQAYEPYESATLVVTAGAATRITPKLTKTGSVSGIVTVAGQPAKGVVVSVADVDLENGTTTDANGRYTVAHVPTGRSVLYFTGQGTVARDYFYRQYQKHIAVKITSGKRTSLNVTEPKPTLLTATVIPTKGAKNLTVRLVAKAGRYPAVDHYEKVRAGAKSVAVSLRGIAAGHYTLVLTDSTAKRYLKKSVTLRYGRTTALGSVALRAKTVSLSGAVASTAPVGVSFTNRYGYPVGGTVADGRYRITGIVPGTGAIRVSGDRSTGSPYFVDDKYYSVRLTKSTTVDVTDGGPQVGIVTGSAAVNGYRIFSTFSLDGGTREIPLASSGDYRSNLVYVDKSALRGEAAINGAIAYRLTDQFSGFKKDFVTGSPFWFDLPSGSVSISSTRGSTTDAGTIDFVARR